MAERMRSHVQAPDSTPLLIFPEGTCGALLIEFANHEDTLVLCRSAAYGNSVAGARSAVLTRGDVGSHLHVSCLFPHGLPYRASSLRCMLHARSTIYPECEACGAFVTGHRCTCSVGMSLKEMQCAAQ